MIKFIWIIGFSHLVADFTLRFWRQICSYSISCCNAPLLLIAKKTYSMMVPPPNSSICLPFASNPSSRRHLCLFKMQIDFNARTFSLAGTVLLKLCCDYCAWNVTSQLKLMQKNNDLFSSKLWLMKVSLCTGTYLNKLDTTYIKYIIIFNTKLLYFNCFVCVFLCLLKIVSCNSRYIHSILSLGYF